MLKRLLIGCFFFSVFTVSAQDPCFNLIIQQLSTSCDGMFDGELMAFTDAVSPDYLWLDADTNPLFPSQEAQVAINLQPGTFLLQITDENGCVELSDPFVMEPLDSTNIHVEHSQGFDIDPVGFNTWTECEVQINNWGCDGHFKPHYVIEHSQPIEQGAFEIEYWRTMTSTWDPLYYDVVDGVVYGYYGDELGEDLGAAGIQTRKIRVRFSQSNPVANLGDYTAYLTVFTADEQGNVLDLVSNTDTLTVELVNLCETFTVDELQIENASCANVSDASLAVVLSGGMTEYLYSLDEGNLFQSEASFDSLSAGAYVLQFMDSNNCLLDTLVTIGPASLMLDTLLFSALTTSSVMLEWNTSPLVDGYRFRYKPVDSTDWIIAGAGAWDDGVAEMLDEKLITSLLADTEHEFQVKVNALSDFCEEGWSASYYANTLAMTLSATVLETCVADSTGSIDLLIEGGVPPFTVQWLGPNGFTSDSVSIDSLVIGDYALYIEDSSIPSISLDTFFVVMPITTIPYLIGRINPSCCGLCDGLIELDMLNIPNASFTYLINGEEAMLPENEVFFYDNCPGDYTVEIVDSMDCVWTNYLTIGDLACLDVDTVNFMSPDNAVVHPLCNGDSTGAIYVSGSGGFANYSFAINNGAYQNEAAGGMGNELFDGLAAGSYWVKIQDGNDCLDSINVLIDSVPPIVVNELLIDTAFCYGACYDTLSGQMNLGSIEISASGGTLFPPSMAFQYSLDEDSALYQYNNVFASLFPGNYSVNVKDDVDCVIELDIELPQYGVSYNYNTTDVSCAGNTDGQFELNQLWDANGTEQFFVNGTSLNGLMTGLAPDTYSLNYSYQYEENSSCWCTDAFVVQEPMPLIVMDSIQNPTCRESCDGSIVLNVQGGTPPYVFNYWSNQETVPSLTNLCGGFYSIQLQDSQGCGFFEQYSMVDPSTIYPIIVQSDDTLFVLEPTEENPTAGTAPYTYQWFLNGALLLENIVPQIIMTEEGEYSVLVVDVNDCEGLSSSLSIELSSVVVLDEQLASLDVYPNPSDGVFHFYLANENIQSVSVCDVYGRKINFQSEQLPGLFPSIDLTSLKNGTYYVEVTTDNSTYFKAIVLNRN